MASELRIRLDTVLESLLATLAERHGRISEEEAARLLKQELRRAAEECLDLPPCQAWGLAKIPECRPPSPLWPNPPRAL